MTCTIMRKAYTFRCTKLMEQNVSDLMQTWNLDRTSIIKLALYLFCIHSKKCKIAHQDLYALVREIESLAPPEFPDYGSFAD